MSKIIWKRKILDKERNLLAIIVPARKGSKRFPGKNKKILKGLSLTDIAIQRSLESQLGVVVLTTDDESLIQGIQVKPHYIIYRDPQFAEGDIRVWQACLDAVNCLIHEDRLKLQNVLFTLPTSPLATAEDLISAYNLFCENPFTPVMSMSPVKINPLLLFRRYRDEKEVIVLGSLKKISWDMRIKSTRTDRGTKEYWRSNGAVYICGIEWLRENKEVYAEGMRAYFMDDIRGLDVDIEEDFIKARSFYKMLDS